MKRFRQLLNKYLFIFQKIDTIIRVIITLVSILVVGAVVIDYGFPLNEYESNIVNNIYSIGWWTYIISFTLQLIFSWSQIRKKALSLTTFLGATLYLSALPKIFNFANSVSWLADTGAFLEHKYFVVPLLGLFAAVEISRAISKFINRRTNPALLVVLCFAFTIIFGALLLMLPRSTVAQTPIEIIDALFTSTSAVCVTGLTTVDVSSSFTLEGQIIIALLIQIGGLGIMTITSFFAVFFMDGLGLYSQFALKDMLSSGAESLISTLLHVLGFTLIIEAAGALLIWFSIHPLAGMTLQEEIFFSIFHSISAFCNAGFSTLEGGLGNEAIILDHNMFYLVISALIVLGGIGFPILINLKRQFNYYASLLFYRIFKRGRGKSRYSHLVDVNTKIVLYASLTLIAIGALTILGLEWNHSFEGLSISEKVTHSIFNSIVPRTAGFNSVEVGNFSRLTIVIVMVLMWIGGASQSTAGGVKVNTLVVAFAALRSIIQGKPTTELFNREITYNTIRRTLAIIIGSILVIASFFITLLVLEPQMGPMDLLFETISAFSTVGLSLGITTSLCTASKFAVVVLMFIGRVGIITVMMSIIPREEPKRRQLPKENIIIN